MDELAGLPGEVQRVRYWPTVAVSSVMFGVISGGLLAAIDAYHLLLYNDATVLAFGPIIAGVWFISGFVPGHRTASVTAGTLAALIAAVSGVLLAVAVDQWLIHATIRQWLAHLNASLPPTAAYVTPDEAYGAELQGMLESLVILPPLGTLLGAFGSFLSIGNSLRRRGRYQFTRREAQVMASDYGDRLSSDHIAQASFGIPPSHGRRRHRTNLIGPVHQVITNEVPRTDDPLAP